MTSYGAIETEDKMDDYDEEDSFTRATFTRSIDEAWRKEWFLSAREYFVNFWRVVAVVFVLTIFVLLLTTTAHDDEHKYHKSVKYQEPDISLNEDTNIESRNTEARFEWVGGRYEPFTPPDGTLVDQFSEGTYVAVDLAGSYVTYSFEGTQSQIGIYAVPRVNDATKPVDPLQSNPLSVYSRWNVWVDGVQLPDLLVHPQASRYVVCSQLESGYHEVVLRKDNPPNGEYGGPVQVSLVTLPLHDPPKPSKNMFPLDWMAQSGRQGEGTYELQRRYLQFIGGKVAAGAGAAGWDEQCDKSGWGAAAWCPCDIWSDSSLKAYPHITSQILNAGYELIAQSGGGHLGLDAKEDPSQPDDLPTPAFHQYERSVMEWDHSRWDHRRQHPDGVVIAIAPYLTSEKRKAALVEAATLGNDTSSLAQYEAADEDDGSAELGAVVAWQEELATLVHNIREAHGEGIPLLYVCEVTTATVKHGFDQDGNRKSVKHCQMAKVLFDQYGGSAAGYHYIDVGHIVEEGSYIGCGCGGWPSAITQANMAEKIADKLGDVLKWRVKPPHLSSNDNVDPRDIQHPTMEDLLTRKRSMIFQNQAGL